jgi:hypothetical protein
MDKIDHLEAPNLLVDKTNMTKPLTCRNKRSINCEQQMPPYIETMNRFTILHNLNDDGTHGVLARNNNTHSKQQLLGNKLSKEIPVILNGYTSTEAKKEMDPTYKLQQRKVVIIGDSHARGCAVNIKHMLNDGYKIQIQGIVKPGACVNTLTSSAKYDIEQLTNKDALVFWGGTNDIGKNDSQKALRHIVDFVTENSHTNIVLLSALQWHDLYDWSSVNKEVQTFNRKLKKCMKRFKHVKMVNVEQNRELFTSHGLHMNKHGKRKIALQVVNTILPLFHKQSCSPIKLGWMTQYEEEPAVITCDDSVFCQDESNMISAINDQGKNPDGNRNKGKHFISNKSELLKSNNKQLPVRNRRLPVTRSEDFLW